MDYKRLLERIVECGEWSDAADCLSAWFDEEGKHIEEAHGVLNRIAVEMRSKPGEGLYRAYRKVLFLCAPYCLDDFMQAIEYDKAYKNKFYLPRRNYLRPMVEGYQKVLDGELDYLTISMPKRAGKTQTEINFALMLSGRNPNGSTLMEGAGDALIKSFYNGALEYLESGNEYAFYEIFPDAKLVQTNADLKTINLDKRSRFPTIMCRSIDSTQVGLSEANNALILDDCVEGREEAKNRQRLDDKWEVINGDVIGRALEGTPIIATGTRYSLYDPIGRLQEKAKTEGKRILSVEIPALDEKTDESNYEFFNPKIGRSMFTTEFFRSERKSLSAEQFESEFQQQPFEAKGLLFDKSHLNYYSELPVDVDPDARLAICDTAESGSDSTAMVILYVYGEDVFVEDVVFDSSASEYTKPQVARKIIDHSCSIAKFESNNAGMYYARDVDELIRSMGGRCSVQTKRTVTNKQTRIEIASDNIIKHFFFKHAEPGSQYWDFMKEVTTYTRSGKVAHDDAPDVLSLAENELRGIIGSRVEIMNRLW